MQIRQFKVHTRFFLPIVCQVNALIVIGVSTGIVALKCSRFYDDFELKGNSKCW